MCVSFSSLSVTRDNGLLVDVHRLRGTSAGLPHSKTDFSDNIAHRDMEQYLAFEPIDVVRAPSHYSRLLMGLAICPVSVFVYLSSPLVMPTLNVTI